MNGDDEDEEEKDEDEEFLSVVKKKFDRRKDRVKTLSMDDF